MKKKKKFKLVMLLTLCILGYFTYTIIGQERIIREKQNQITSINQKIDDEESKNSELKKRKEEVSSLEYIEEVARKKLGYVKPEERIYVDVNK